MDQSIPLLKLTVRAAADVPAYRFVTYAGALCGAGALAIGVSDYPAATGADFAAVVIGTATVEAGGAITAGAEVQSDATGRAVTAAGGEVLGLAWDGASGAGRRLEVLLTRRLGGKMGQILAHNDITEIDAAGAVPISGIALIAGGTGLPLTLAAPQPGCLARIRVASLSSGNVVITCAAGVTYDGVNNTATANAAGDELVLGYKSPTRWGVIENTSVILSAV